MLFRRVPASRFGTYSYDPVADRYEFDAAARQILGHLAQEETHYQDFLDAMPAAARQEYEHWRHEATTGQAGRARIPLRIGDVMIVLEEQVQSEGKRLRGIVADVSADEEERRALKVHLEVLELAARVVRFGVWTYHVKEDRFSASQEAVDLILPGADPAQFSLEAVLALIHPDDRKPLLEAHNRALHTGQVQVVEFRHAGRWFMVHFTRGLDDEGNPVHTRGLIHETTPVHQRVALQQAAWRMEEQELRQQRMVMSAAHELRQPLTPLRLHLGALRRLLKDRDDAAKSLDLIERNLDRVALMLRDLLDATKSQAGRLEVEPQAMDVVPEVTRVVETMSELASQRRIHLEWHPAKLPVVHADPMRLEQCISNLVHNAIKFTKEGTEVCVEAAVQDGSLVLRVQDQGPGLSEHQAEEVFEPFHQVHQGPPGFAGTGLGLYVTRSLMQAMGGDVEVDTEPGKGARFTLRLPVAPHVEATRR